MPHTTGARSSTREKHTADQGKRKKTADSVAAFGHGSQRNAGAREKTAMRMKAAKAAEAKKKVSKDERRMKKVEKIK
jgi:hypothetical protein